MKRTRNTSWIPWRWAVLGIAIGALLVLSLATPARWLASALASWSGHTVILTEPQGSLWHGSSQLVLAGGSGSRDQVALPGRIHWQIHPIWFGLKVNLTADCCTPAGPLGLQLRPRWRGAHLAIDNGQSQWPADLLSGLGTPWNTVQPDGDIALTTKDMRVDIIAGRTHMEGNAEIAVRGLSSRLSTLRPLGSYRVNLRGGSEVSMQLSTVEGGLLMHGSGRWVGRRLHFSGEAQAAPGMETQLANLLNLMGRRQGHKALIVIN